MSQIVWAAGDHSVITGWDPTTARFHLTIEDAPTGEVEYDCYLMNAGTDAQWVLDALDGRSIERPAELYALLAIHREADAGNVVVRLHHSYEHELLGEPLCKTSDSLIDIRLWVRFDEPEDDDDFGDGAVISHAEVNGEPVAGVLTSRDNDEVGVIYGDGYGWQDCQTITEARAWIATNAQRLSV